ncbi:FG-GAP repeat protein [Enhygromyxa salina]|uniref:FG-GAP repeat protein n=1 Tax=Enhygromyxa salina TaxID=215803 RepID=UPI003B8A5A4C
MSLIRESLQGSALRVRVRARAYLKASNAGPADWFGRDVALNGDGSTLAVGAIYEDRGATGIGGDPADNSAAAAGATPNIFASLASQLSSTIPNDIVRRFGRRLALLPPVSSSASRPSITRHQRIMWVQISARPPRATQSDLAARPRRRPRSGNFFPPPNTHRSVCDRWKWPGSRPPC